MNVAAPPVLRPEDFPEVDPNLLAAISRALRAQFDALSSVPTIAFREGLRFKSDDSGAASLEVALDFLPKHAWITNLASSDGADFSLVYSATAVRQKDGLRFTFAGLSAATEYVCSVGYA